MAPGDKMFYIISYENKTNKMNSFKKRELANTFYEKIDPNVSRVMISGETGDIL